MQPYLEKIDVFSTEIYGYKWRNVTQSQRCAKHFLHEMPKVVPRILTCLKYVRFQRCQINRIFSTAFLVRRNKAETSISA
jgi:hypothetical protein